MPNGWSRPEAKTSLLLGLAAPSAARRTRIYPGSDSAMKMSPFGATRTRVDRGSWRRTVRPQSPAVPSGWRKPVSQSPGEDSTPIEWRMAGAGR
jgi:hypothetical protein